MNARLVGAADGGGRRAVESRGRRGARLHARGAVRSAQPQRVEPVHVREVALFRQEPGQAELRIEHALERLAERAVAVVAQPAREEHAVVVREDLLGVAAEGDRQIGARGGRLNGTGADLRCAGREVLARRTRDVVIRPVVLNSRRRFRRDGAERIEGRRRTTVQRVL